MPARLEKAIHLADRTRSILNRMEKIQTVESKHHNVETLVFIRHVPDVGHSDRDRKPVYGIFQFIQGARFHITGIYGGTSAGQCARHPSRAASDVQCTVAMPDDSIEYQCLGTIQAISFYGTIGIGKNIRNCQIFTFHKNGALMRPPGFWQVLVSRIGLEYRYWGQTCHAQ